jgi:hypothetical protein
MKTFRKWQNHNRIIKLDLTSSNHLVYRNGDSADHTQMQLNDLSTISSIQNLSAQNQSSSTVNSNHNSLNILLNFNEKTSSFYQLKANDANQKRSSPKIAVYDNRAIDNKAFSSVVD